MSINPTPVEGGRDYLRNLERRLGHMERHRHPTALVEEHRSKTPEAPENVQWERVKLGGGWGVQTTWEEVLLNTDGSDFVPGHYELEQQIGGKIVYGEIDSLAPMRPDPILNRLYDRRDLPTGWIGGDGGASLYLGGDKSMWFWSDSMIGRVDSEWRASEDSFMRNSITTTVGVDRESLRYFAGTNNMFPDEMSMPKASWISDLSISGGSGSQGTWTHRGHSSMLVTAPGGWTFWMPDMPASPGKPYVGTVVAEGSGVEVRLQFVAPDGSILGISDPGTAAAGKQASSIGVAPAGTAKVRVRINGTGTTSVTKIGLFQTDNRMLSWRPQTKSITYTNLFTNPDGVRSTQSSGSVEVARNLSTNPSFTVDASGWRAYGGASEPTRVVTASAWSGEAVGRFTPSTSRTGLFAMHYPIPVTTGVGISARLRVRGRVASGRTLKVRVNSYQGGSGLGYGSDVAVSPVEDEWTTVNVNLPAEQNTGDGIGIQLFHGDGAWDASDWIEVDGVEVYSGSTTPLVEEYFDGSTSPREGYEFSWAGTPGNSASIMRATTELRRNLAINPEVRSTTGYSAISGSVIAQDYVDTPSGGTGVVKPAITNEAALNSFRTVLSQAATRSVRIGWIGDSTVETTGSLSSAKMEDRAVERLQASLRRSFPAPGVSTYPKGFNGASTVIPAFYVHGGPIDWTFEGPDAGAPGQVGYGWGGRYRNIDPGHRAILTATFDQVRLAFRRSGWGRFAHIIIDGVSVDEVDTFASESNTPLYWTSQPLGSGEHTIVVEYRPRDGVSAEGSVTLVGAELFDGDRTKGVRVYDLSSSGKAAEDANGSSKPELSAAAELGLDLAIIQLGVNDAGRSRTSAQFKSDVQGIITELRARGFTGKVLLAGQWDVAGGTSPEPYSAYRAVMGQIAQADAGVASIDLSTVMGTPADNSRGLFSDTVHPSAAGQKVIADTVYAALLPTPSGEGALSVTGSTPGFTIPVPLTNHGEQFTASMTVKAPAGSTLTIDYAVGTGSYREAVTFTAAGTWQKIQSWGMIRGGDSGSPTVRVRSTAPFRVGRVLVEESGSVGEFFSGSTPAPNGIAHSWAGAAHASQSVKSMKVPALWAPETGSLALFSTEAHRSIGSVRITARPDGTASAVADLPTSTAARTLVAWVKAAEGATIVATVRNSSAATIATRTFTGTGGWIEARVPSIPSGAEDVRFSATNLSSDGLLVAELTFVAGGTYAGPAFSGRMSASHVEASWTGTVDSSTSLLKLNSTDVVGGPNSPTSLVSPSFDGAPPNEVLWMPGAHHVVNGKLYAFYNGVVHVPVMGGGWNFEMYGQTYVATFSGPEFGIFEDLQKWATGHWGDTAIVGDDGYLYVYGSVGDSITVCRVPQDNVLSTPSVRKSDGTWGTGTPGQVAVDQGGFTAVRELDGEYVALSISGYDRDLRAYYAPHPGGPWVQGDSVYTFPSDGARYVPRFHEQFDENGSGASVGYAEVGTHGPQFLRGTPGPAQSSYDQEIWGDRVTTESLQYVKELAFESPYRVRVRAVNIAGVPSEWTVGFESLDPSPDPTVPTPSAPTVTNFFRGARVVWDGTTEYGDRYENFVRYEVHIGQSPTFAPNGWTRMDMSTLEGGTSTVFVNDWERYYVRIVVVTEEGESAPSEAVPFDPERLSDSALAGMLIENAKFAPGSISASALTVSSFTDSLVPNGNMEDVEPYTDSEPALWFTGWPRGARDWSVEPWPNAGSMTLDTNDPISGARSLRIDTYADTSIQVVSEKIPLVPGDIYYVSLKLRTSTLSGDISLSLKMGETEADVNGFDGPTSKTVEFARTAGSTYVMEFEGQVEVPDAAGDGSGHAMKWGVISIDAYATGLPYSTWVDDVQLRKVTGSAAIADASINRAKIRYLAVDDARIASVGVGKLTAGYLSADMVVGSRIMTAETGQRVEMNREGLFGFNPSVTGSESLAVTEVRASDGGLVSRWLRTNTAGNTRIEMGTYNSMDPGNGAFMSFHPYYAINQSWQFPPAFGYSSGGTGGVYSPVRGGYNYGGLAIHAGSRSEVEYAKYGMNMLSVDQSQGIHLVTGNLLDGTEATDGAPVTINAGGDKSYIDIRSGGSQDPGRLHLDPNPGESFLSLNRGRLQFLNSASDGQYFMEFIHGTQWLGTNHLLIDAGDGWFRLKTGSSDTILVRNNSTRFYGLVETDGNIGSGGIFQGFNPLSGDGRAARLRSREDTTIEFDRYGNPWTSDGTARANTAMWVNSAGNVEGLGDWNVPRIKVRAQESYISWNAHGDAYVDGVGVKTFVIPHPVEPDEKFLVHAAHEGPDMRVVYEGVAHTVDREAVVTLPSYFEELVEPGTDVVMVQALLCECDRCSCAVKASRVKDGSFRVVAHSTSHDVEFSWRVTAVRRGTAFEVEPARSDVTVRGDGPYTYIESRA